MCYLQMVARDSIFAWPDVIWAKNPTPHKGLVGKNVEQPISKDTWTVPVEWNMLPLCWSDVVFPLFKWFWVRMLLHHRFASWRVTSRSGSLLPRNLQQTWLQPGQAGADRSAASIEAAASHPEAHLMLAYHRFTCFTTEDLTYTSVLSLFGFYNNILLGCGATWFPLANWLFWRPEWHDLVSQLTFHISLAHIWIGTWPDRCIFQNLGSSPIVNMITWLLWKRWSKLFLTICSEWLVGGDG